jgi:Fe-S-cluster containining protein
MSDIKKTTRALQKMYKYIAGKRLSKIRKEFLSAVSTAEDWRRNDLAGMGYSCGLCVDCCKRMPILYAPIEKIILENEIAKMVRPVREHVEDRAAALLEKWKRFCGDYGVPWAHPPKSDLFQFEWTEENEWCPFFLGHCLVYKSRPIFCRVGAYQVCRPFKHRTPAPIPEMANEGIRQVLRFGNQHPEFNDTIPPESGTTIEDWLIRAVQEMNRWVKDRKPSGIIPILSLLTK